MAHHIAIYGKGGVGKSTLAANLGAALAEMDRKVVLIGCDPKSDCAALLHSGETRPSVIELIASGRRISLEEVVTKGYRGIACIEVGDPFHTGECASRGIGRAFELLHELDVFGRLAPDLVLYDIPGDPGCLGFTSPIGNPLVADRFCGHLGRRHVPLHGEHHLQDARPAERRQPGRPAHSSPTA